MITLKDIDPPVAEALTKLIASFKEIGEEAEGQQIVDNILLRIEEGRVEAELIEAVEAAEAKGN
jgi:hypothetical protein